MMNIRNKSLRELILDAEQVDATDNRELFLQYIERNPRLQKHYNEYDREKKEKFLKRANEVQKVCFETNYDSGKDKIGVLKNIYPYIRVYTGLAEEYPIISLHY